MPRSLRISLSILPLFFGASFLWGQVPTQAHQNPDCQFTFTFTAASQTAPTVGTIKALDNRQTGCTVWAVTYFPSGFSGLSLVLESAPNNNGTPGTFITGFPLQQTVITGSNPQTSATGGYLWISGAGGAWVRIRLATVSGSGNVMGSVYGWKIPNAQ